MKKTPPNKYRRKDHGMWSSTDEDGMNGAFSIPIGHNTTANCVVSDGLGWEHVSVHVADRDGKQRTPSWAQMCQIKDIFWEPEECVVQFHPPKSEYVNNHPNVLHLWRPTNVEFPRPSNLMVGIQALDQIG